MKNILYLLLTLPLFAIAQEQDPCFSVTDFINYTEEANPTITKNFVGGWNMFGFPCSQEIDIVEAFSSIIDKVLLVKTNNGSVYMPEYGFNGIGLLVGGEGYQIKMANTVYGFSFCEPITWANLEGCSDCEATNFNQWANVDDGSCNYDSDGDGVPDSEEIIGCQDANACNYNQSATDEGDCSFAEQGFECFQITQGNIHKRVANWISNPDSTEAIYGHISDWDVSYVSDMSSLFKDYSTFNDDISSWDVSNVIDMSLMFWSAAHFSSDLSSWDVSNVSNMSFMFFNANNFTGDLSSWDVSNVIDMAQMFSSCDNFTSDLSIWDVSNVIDMTQMFTGCDDFTSDLSSWDVSNVITMLGMFHAAENFSSNLSSWDVSNVNNMSSMFRYALNFSSDLSSWDISNVTNMSNMFEDANLSTENQCAIQTSFSTNPYWPYEWECPSLQVGDLAEGGIVFYYDSIGGYGLVAALEDVEGTYEWGCYGIEVNGVNDQAIGLGYQNTLNLVNLECTSENGDLTAAEAAVNFESGGYSDWFLPSQDELAELYIHLSQESINISSYNFNFSDNWYWSSSEVDDEWAHLVNFYDGEVNVSGKASPKNIGVVRAFGNWTMGCMDETACNYNSEANMADGNCEYPQQGYDCDGNITAQIGDVMEGGYLFYLDESGTRGLVAALDDIGAYEWGCFNENVQGADGTQIGAGYQNTLDIFNQGCVDENGGMTAATIALEYVSDNLSDWYLPSKDELSEMYTKIGNGSIQGNTGNFVSTWYWSSSEINNSTAWYISFSNFLTSTGSKTFNDLVRPIRAFGNWTMGCMDETACNFNIEANMVDGSCTYLQEGYDCDGAELLQIGDNHQGGYVFQINEDGTGLVANTSNLGEMQWWDAIAFAQSYTSQGYDDWYLPSVGELEGMYYAIGNGGLQGDIGGFYDVFYWSSSENNNPCSYGVSFDNGQVYGYLNKDYTYEVRVIRAF